MRQTGKGALRAHLKKLQEAECREQILELWDRFPAVRDYFASRFSSEGSNDVLARSKAQIARGFATSLASPRVDLIVLRKVITEFRRSQVRPEATIELLLFYVGEGLDFVGTFGDDRPVNSIVRTFSQALQLADQEDLIEAFQATIERLVDRAEGIGWGLGDHLFEEWVQHKPLDSEGESPQRA